MTAIPQLASRAKGGISRSGFSLVELIVAMALFGIVMVMLGSLSLTVTRRGRTNEYHAKRNLALAQQAGRIEAMPFKDVATITSGTTQMLVGDFTFNRRFTVTQAATNRYTIKIVIAPITNEFTADSVTIDKTRPASGMPLCTSC
jgi:prepilin-type N-terminal cleavage/methylation domain-containing protein